MHLNMPSENGHQFGLNILAASFPGMTVFHLEVVFEALLPILFPVFGAEDETLVFCMKVHF